MYERRKITEIVIKESSEICSIVPNSDGTFSLIDSQGKLVKHNQYDSVGYLRDSGKPKILRSIAREKSNQLGDNPWKKYDKIGFIDTNSVAENGRKLFVSSPSLLIWEDENRRFANVFHVDFLVGFCSDKVNPERVGWVDFIQRLQTSPILTATDKVLIVVDSEKGLIPSINEKVEPVFNEFMLPSRFTIGYASDAGAKNWINQEIKKRHQVSALILEKVKQDQKLLKILEESGHLHIKNDFE